MILHERNMKQKNNQTSGFANYKTNLLNSK